MEFLSVCLQMKRSSLEDLMSGKHLVELEPQHRFFWDPKGQKKHIDFDFLFDGKITEIIETQTKHYES